MAEYALFVDGQLKEIRRYDAKPEDIPHKSVSWHEVVRTEGETAFNGLENGKWVIRSALPTLVQLKANRLAELANMRWQKETGGIVLNGASVATDEISQTKLIGAVVGAQMDPEVTMKWKMKDGAFVTLDATTIVGVAMAVRAHIQACFDREAELKAEIEAASNPDAMAAIDIAEGWPE
jgi:hypothetical protein